MKETENTKYLRMFFEEKNLPHKDFEITTEAGTYNLIPSEVVIEHIMIAPEHEKEQIANIIRKIDFMNGDVNHFLKHLAGAIARDI
jgi:hypothetical protein